MIIKLRRAPAPEPGWSPECAFCGERFIPESVLAHVLSDSRMDLGVACRECVGMMGRRSPEKYPTLEEFEAALRRFPTPIWSSTEEADRVWELDEGATYNATVEANQIARAVPENATRFGTLGANRRELFESIVGHLDHVALIDEEDHGGSWASEHIRDVLIPFAEREGGLKTHEQWLAEFRARRTGQ